MSVPKIILLLLTSFFLMSSVFAASKSREFGLDGNYIKVQAGPSSSLLNVSLGQFLTPQAVIVTTLTTQNNFAYKATSIGLGGKFYFFDGFKGDLVPFAGIGIALRQISSTNNQSATQTDFNLGAAYFLAENTTVDVKFRFFTYNDSSPNVYLLAAGFSQRF
jgi:hypothetical protein